LVIWGIYAGKFSPTEAAGVTAGFCLIVGLVMYPLNKMLGELQENEGPGKTLARTLVVQGFKLDELPSVIMRSGQITGLLAPLIAVSVVMQQILSLLGANEFVTNLLGNLGGYYPILFACMAIVLLAGTILESLPNTIILAPILAPIGAGIGVDPIHFAVIFLVGDAIGFITPPYGLNLYVASGITGIPYFRLLKYTVPYLLALMIAWMFIILIPELSTMLLVHEGAGIYQHSK
jgi:TRAP-type C4-dicarboxylate transport system permease large subunit